MDYHDIVALVVFALAVIILVQRHLTGMILWMVLAYTIAHYLIKMPNDLAVNFSILIVGLIAVITGKTFEGFEEEKKEAEKEPEAAPPKTDDPHVDIGTTILHAYRNLSPEQIGGMRRDTKELMGLQKELMGSLSEMKPAIEQGAELLKTFSQFFGKNE